MKVIQSSIVFIVFLIGCSQGEKKEVKYYPSGNLKSVYITNTDESIVRKTFFDSSEELIESIGTVRNGKLNGKFETFYKPGGLQRSCYFIDHVIDGEVKEYYENGSLRKLYHAKLGVENGVNINWDPSGEIVSVVTAKDGKPQGFSLKDKRPFYIYGDTALKARGNVDENFHFYAIDYTEGKIHLASSIDGEWRRIDVYSSENCNCDFQQNAVFCINDLGERITLPDSLYQITNLKEGQVYSLSHEGCPFQFIEFKTANKSYVYVQNKG
jgi:hypothetical protein